MKYLIFVRNTVQIISLSLVHYI